MKYENLEEARNNAENVTELNLDCNSTGPVFDPSSAYSVYDISGRIGSLSMFKNLEKLSLASFPLVSGYGHQVNDELLNSLWGLKKLKEITFAAVCFTEVPKGLCELPNLESLRFINVYELKTIPNWIGELSNLTTLSIQGAMVLKSLPAEVANLAKLEFLHLTENKKLKEINFDVDSLPNLKEDCKNKIKILIHEIKNPKPKKYDGKLELKALKDHIKDYKEEGYKTVIPARLKDFWKTGEAFKFDNFWLPKGTDLPSWSEGSTFQLKLVKFSNWKSEELSVDDAVVGPIGDWQNAYNYLPIFVHSEQADFCIVVKLDNKKCPVGYFDEGALFQNYDDFVDGIYMLSPSLDDFLASLSPTDPNTP